MFGTGSPEKPLQPEERERDSLHDRVTGHLKHSAQQDAHAGASTRSSAVGILPHKAVQISAVRSPGFLLLDPWA